MTGFETEFNFHKWPNVKPIVSGRYLVYAYETDEDPYTIDARWIIGDYCDTYGWDANLKVVAWTSLPPDLPIEED